MNEPGLPAIEFDCEGPVQAEVFVVWLNGARLELSGPCGAAPWYIEVGAGEHPLDVVSHVVGQALGPPRLVHSTSWRRERARPAFRRAMEKGAPGMTLLLD